jgi:RNA polymerase sigma-70 factor (ECF subfamily)
MESPAGITRLLEQWSAGDSHALQELLPLVYTQLRDIARQQMRRERTAHTLQPTALVNELYLQLSKQHAGQWKSRGQFFTFAAMLMRRILTDYARHTRAEKRGGDLARVPLSDDLPWLGNSRQEVLSLDRTLDVLERTDPRKVRVLELRALLGCTAQETAEALDISKATADREWTLAKAWLYRELKRTGPPEVSA